MAFLSCLPNFVIMAPSNEQELINMIKTSVSYNDGPLAIRYPRGEANTTERTTEAKTIKIGKGKILLKNYTNSKKGDIAFLSIGTRLDDTLGASKKLVSAGYAVSVADARFAKPIDNQMILELANNNNNLLIIEEASSGGFSSSVISFLANSDLTNSKFRVKTMSMPDYFIDHKSQEEQIAQAGLNTESIFKKARSLLEDNNVEAIG